MSHNILIVMHTPCILNTIVWQESVLLHMLETTCCSIYILISVVLQILLVTMNNNAVLLRISSHILVAV